MTTRQEAILIILIVVAVLLTLASLGTASMSDAELMHWLQATPIP